MNANLESFVLNLQVAEQKVRRQAKDSPLVRALGLAHYWQRLLDEGKFRSFTEIFAIEGIDLGQASRIAKLTRLSPEIVQGCLSSGRDMQKREQLG